MTEGYKPRIVFEVYSAKNFLALRYTKEEAEQAAQGYLPKWPDVHVARIQRGFEKI